MCKVLIIPAIKNKTLTMSFAQRMGVHMSKGNSDGLGYAAIDSKGNLFGERWLNNMQAFVERPEYKPLVDVSKNFGSCARGVLPGGNSRVYGSFGDVALHDVAAITLHTRYATSAKGFTNCHPFVENDTSLIHNGMISNWQQFDLKHSTNDSEAILQSYLNHEGGNSVSNVGDAMMDLTGYYAAALFSRDADDNRILDVTVGNNPNFYASWVAELGTYVLTTDYKDIAATCAELSLTMGEIVSFNDGIVMRIDPFTGVMLDELHFRPNQRQKMQKAKPASKASFKKFPASIIELTSYADSPREW